MRLVSQATEAKYWCLTALLLAAMIIGLVSPAEARKVALVIGNSAYANTSPLENPPNDAQLVADAARRTGFDDVVVQTDLGLTAFQNALREFRQKALGAEVAMVYYAGHGMEAQGRNWLLPVDAALETSYDLPYEAVEMQRVLETLDGAKLRMVVLDACRNNPFGRSWKSGTRSVSRGLAEIDVDDILVIYAAAPGQVANDGGGNNSPFARALADHLPTAGLPVQLLGGMVRDDVLEATGGTQRPYVSASITGTPIYLAGTGENPVGASATAQPEAFFEAPPAATEEARPATPAGFINAFLPGRYDIEAGEPMPIDGVWRISTLNKRIRIERGRGFAVDGWQHLIVTRVMPDMVVLKDLQRDGAGQYSGSDILVGGRAKMRLRGDGHIEVHNEGTLVPVKYVLIRESVDDATAFADEKSALTN